MSFEKTELEYYKNETFNLRNEVYDLKQEIQLRDSIIREHAEAASIFQPDGKYHKEAELPLGGSCVVEGIKWMDYKIKGLKMQNNVLKMQTSVLIEDHERISSKLFVSENRNTYLRLSLEKEKEGWDNKWQCAVEMAAIAENKLAAIKEIID